ncbi:MAG TPA: ChaN family lipoprotein [Kofleriaceae bacterium]|jgi:uncharacterized iron-regulated protein
MRAHLLIAAALVGCGGGGGRGADEPRGADKAALPFQVLRARGGQVVPWDGFIAELAAADAVCIGEHHPSPHDHWAQLEILRAVGERARGAGRAPGLGLEMFQRPFQGVVDDFVAGRIDEAALLSRAAWKDRWGYDWSLYRPMVLLARERGAAILALNTERELTKKVSRQGLDKMPAADRAKLPQLVLDDAQHRSWWKGIMGDMGGAHGHPSGEDDDGDEAPAKKDAEAEAKEKAEAAAADERIYAAQVLWDETMADGASKWLAGGPKRHLVILAGNGHCHESAIVRRLERRGVKAAVSVHPIVDDGEGNVAALLAEPENDYLFVMSPPR